MGNKKIRLFSHLGFVCAFVCLGAAFPIGIPQLPPPARLEAQASDLALVGMLKAQRPFTHEEHAHLVQLLGGPDRLLDLGSLFHRGLHASIKMVLRNLPDGAKKEWVGYLGVTGSIEVERANENDDESALKKFAESVYGSPTSANALKYLISRKLDAGQVLEVKNLLSDLDSILNTFETYWAPRDRWSNEEKNWLIEIKKYLDQSQSQPASESVASLEKCSVFNRGDLNYPTNETMKVLWVPNSSVAVIHNTGLMVTATYAAAIDTKAKLEDGSVGCKMVWERKIGSAERVLSLFADTQNVKLLSWPADGSGLSLEWVDAKTGVTAMRKTAKIDPNLRFNPRDAFSVEGHLFIESIDDQSVKLFKISQSTGEIEGELVLNHFGRLTTVVPIFFEAGKIHVSFGEGFVGTIDPFSFRWEQAVSIQKIESYLAPLQLASPNKGCATQPVFQVKGPLWIVSNCSGHLVSALNAEQERILWARPIDTDKGLRASISDKELLLLTSDELIEFEIETGKIAKRSECRPNDFAPIHRFNNRFVQLYNNGVSFLIKDVSKNETILSSEVAAYAPGVHAWDDRGFVQVREDKVELVLFVRSN